MADDPFHEGEREIQSRLGVRDRLSRIGPRAIRPFMPDQHRAFFEQIPLIYVGAEDADGTLWASVRTGSPGFISSPDPNTLIIDGAAPPGDPFDAHLSAGKSTGLLGLIFQTRRRNRMNGVIAQRQDNRLTINVTQSFGNCPKYIQQRAVESTSDTAQDNEVIQADRLDQGAKDLLEACDTFFIASRYSEDVNQPPAIDVSHRGGKPGFIQIESESRLIWPDYAGNLFFNTLGNLIKDPAAGILVPDFAGGQLLWLSGKAEIVFDDPRIAELPGAERLVRFEVEKTVRATHAFAGGWSPPELSPFLEFEAS